jgi:hypothetical protein
VGVAVVDVVEEADVAGLAVVADGDVVLLEGPADAVVAPAELSVPDPPAHAVTPSSATARVEAPRSRLVRLRRGSRGSGGWLVAGIRSNLSRHPVDLPNP